ncbi:choline kinase [Aquibium carbonis]|uniref:Choline kinase n=1 Tax=Aquibium carbonis TaxID=2495581 RepID=A0A429YQZ1_9HYPH|nr:choline/ethanolamine kinase family protein [Aquibium carbonis]RST83824.1 choline kinase [Aquibium carbonis]
MNDDLARIRALPIWSGPVEPVPLHGGLSNQSYTVDDAGQTYVVRLGRDYVFHHVIRERELMTARAAHAGGFAPEIVHAEPGVTVSRFIDGKPFSEADMRAKIGDVAAIVRRFHDEMPCHVSGPGFIFWPFHVIRDYALTLSAGRSAFTGDLPGWLALAEGLEAAQIPLPIVFGHHDFLPANIIDDGDRLWLIDFEYAGFGTAMFDLAGIASNAGFSAEESEALLGQYFGRPPSSDIRRAHAAMQCASLLREAMWGMVSALHLDNPGIDYDAYARMNLERLDAALDAYRTQFGKET